MRGIEAAFWGTLLQDVELKKSANGKSYCNFGCAVVTGKADNGKEISQYIRVACFGDAAEALTARAKKGDRVYVEGSLTMSQWNAADGEVKHGLNVAAFRCERIGNIGRNREIKEHSEAPGTNINRPSSSYCAGPAEPRKRSNADGYDWDRGDQLPF
ncbi:MAG: single-stranded DNA-binding protein [Rhodomicrobium sp.]